MPKNRLHATIAVRPSIVGLLILLLGLLACSSEAPSGAPTPDDGPLRIVTTTGMIADTAQRIVGDLGTVEALMGPGIDPHLYKASENDVRRLASAEDQDGEDSGH